MLAILGRLAPSPELCEDPLVAPQPPAVAADGVVVVIDSPLSVLTASSLAQPAAYASPEYSVPSPGYVAAELVEEPHALAAELSPPARLLQLVDAQWGPYLPVMLSATASAVVHMAIVLILGTICRPLVERAVERPDLTAALTLPEEVPLPPEPKLTLALPSEVEQESIFSAAALSMGPVESNTARLESVDPPTELESPIVDIMPPQSIEAFSEDDLLVAQGSAGEEIAEVEGAVDRITTEIAANLELGDVMVVWLMDASLSLVEEREAIAGRLERIYREVDQLATSKHTVAKRQDALMGAVVSFAEGAKELAAPTSDGAKLVQAIREVPHDPTGVENVFSSVLASVNRYLPYRTREQRKMMVVVWTDESGDDYLRMEEAVALCRRMSISVYVVGASAMFGREQGTLAYRHPDDGVVYQLPVDRGPDSVRPERVQVPYWFDGGQLEVLHAGMGPFALSRLAHESGGAYFIAENVRDRSPFRLETMRPYLPEYVSPAEYVRRALASPLRSAVLRAVDITLQRPLRGTPRLTFAPTGDSFQTELREAQESVAHDGMVLDEALAGLDPRVMEKHYQKEPSARWRAWYDLNFGRLLAMRVRCSDYNWACAAMKGKGANFVDEKSNRWRFVPHPEIKYGSATQRQAEEALRLLTRCVEQNPGTPWAELAQRELKYPLGFQVQESYVAPPPPPPPVKATPAKPGKAKMAPPPKGRRAEQPLKLPRAAPPVLPKL